MINKRKKVAGGEISCEDFDNYSIEVPLKNCFGKNYTKYLYSELEKRHPCFSDENCFDSKRHISKNGIFSDVVVMKKLTLADYRKRNSGKRLFYFSSPEQKRFVFDLVQRKMAAVFFGIVLLILILAGIVQIVRQRNNLMSLEGVKEAEKTVTERESENSSGDYESAAESGELIVEERINVGKDFLSVLMENRGKVMSFIWKKGFEKESISAVVKGVFPETLDYFSDCKISAVSYSGGRPVFTADVHNQFERKSLIKKAETLNWKGLRTVISDYGGELISETGNPAGVIFDVPVEKFLWKRNVLVSLGSFLESEKLFVSELGIKQSGQETVRIELKVEDAGEYSEGIDIGLAGQNTLLFIPELKKSVPEVLVQVAPSEMEKSRKLGEILYKDGTKKIFYRNQQGKLIAEVVAQK